MYSLPSVPHRKLCPVPPGQDIVAATTGEIIVPARKLASASMHAFNPLAESVGLVRERLPPLVHVGLAFGASVQVVLLEPRRSTTRTGYGVGG